MQLLKKKREVPGAFDHVAKGYDLFTSLSPGYDSALLKSALHLRLAPGGSVLDLCCGTGKSTRAILKAYPEAQVVGLDGSRSMLEKAEAKIWADGTRFVLGDAMNPLATLGEQRFDAVFMAFGIRNVENPDLCLSRIRELLNPGGVLCIHEYSLDGSARAEIIWKAVTGTIVIPGGWLGSGSTELYRYLRQSVLDFDRRDALAQRIRKNGFLGARSFSASGWQSGVVHTFVGHKSSASS